jgi:hypothetical protein
MVSKRVGKYQEALKIAKVLKKKECKREQVLHCPNAVSVKFGPWKAGARVSDSFLPSLWL